MRIRSKRFVAVLATGALVLGGGLAIAGPAAATNECLAIGSMTSAYDHASTWQSAGTCKFHKIEGKWFIAASTGGYYYASETKKDLDPGGTVFVGYTLPSQYQIVSYRACTDTASYSCAVGSWRTNSTGQVFP